MSAPTSVGAYRSVVDLVAAALAGRLGPDPTRSRVSVGFVTRQGARHAGRGRAYRNHVLSLRVGAAVGCCAVEPGELPDEVAYDCVGMTVAELLAHPLAPVRVAALDAYLMAVRPHADACPDPVLVPGGSSLAKSTARAAAVLELLPVDPGATVLVVGVVNSLLAGLRERGLRYLPCDRAGGSTEWGEPCRPDPAPLLAGCDALLVSGMTLGNGTFEPLLAHARDTGKPLVAFAQTGSAVLPRFLGAGLTAVSAEPYPFFWLDGGPSTVYRYRAAA
ncbi:Rossmann-like domain-containing protein [Micromonospora fluostatini]